MADNITFQVSQTATPPNATTVATDEISGAHYQLMKLNFGDNGTAYTLAYGTPMPIGTTGGTFVINGTPQVLGSISIVGTLAGGSVGIVGTIQALGTFQPLAGSVHVANVLTGTFQSHGTAQIIGTVQTHGTTEAKGTVQPLAGSVHPASMFFGSVQGWQAHDGAAQGNPVLIGAFGSSGTQTAVSDGDVVRPWYDLNGRAQIFGTIGSITGVVVTAIPHVTVDRGTIDKFDGTISGGTIQAFGTTEAKGTVQPTPGSVHLASNLPGGSVNAQGVIAHGAAIAGNPLLIAAFGSSGIPTAVSDGQLARLWTDLNGRLQIRGTIDSMPAISVSSGTIPGGTVQAFGTTEILGTVRALTTVNAVIGTIQEGTINSFTGTAQVLGSVQGVGTFQVLGSVQTIAGMSFGSVQGWQAHDGAVGGNPVLIGAFGSSGTQAAVADGDVSRLWTDLNGRLQVRGTIDSIPNITITAGTVSLNTGGTIHIGTVQRLAGGTLDLINGTVPVGTVRQLLGTVLTKPNAAGEGFFGTRFTGAGATNGTLVPAPSAGTYVRVWDVVVSGSAAGTAFLELGDGTIFGPVFTAANGGWSFNSAKGVRTNGTAQDVLFNYSAGTWGVSVNYTLETA